MLLDFLTAVFINYLTCGFLYNLEVIQLYIVLVTCLRGALQVI